jgi:hypothetical protein
MSDTKNCGHCGGEFARDKRNTYAYWARAKYCSRSCAGAAIAAAKIAARLPRETDFLKWFTPGDGCWEWQGAIDRDGYGIFSYAGKTSRAAREALAFDGRDPGNGFACHHCDNPRCVRPSHLFVGTNRDNMQDMVQKGRNPNRFGPNNPNWKGGTSRRHAA